MDYLNQVLQIHVAYKGNVTKPLPNFIDARYRVEPVSLDGCDAVFLYPKGEMDSVSSIKKHMERAGAIFGVPVILIPDRLTFRQKEYLLREHIPFIVEGRQIYLPFMAVYLQERCDGERPETSSMLPSSQLLFLHYLYRGGGELLASDASRALSLTATSISRASRQLEGMGLIQTKRIGVQKVIYSDKMPEELFSAAKKYLVNPAKRTVYVPKTEIKEGLLVSGYSALSEYSMINPPAVECHAAASIAEWDKVSSVRLQSQKEQSTVELWRYDPKKLPHGACVDRISLALALQDDRDERVEEAVERMLAQVWRDIGGKRE